MIKIRTIFFGGIPTAKKCLEFLCGLDKYHILGVVPESPGYICKFEHGVQVAEFAKMMNLPLLNLDEVPDLNPELGFSVRFNKIISADILRSFTNGIINFHGGPLPYYRGTNCANWAILDKRECFGISAHLIDQGIDTGPIIKNFWWPINNTMTVFEIFKEGLKQIYSAFCEISTKYPDVSFIPQNEINEKKWEIKFRKNDEINKACITRFS